MHILVFYHIANVHIFIFDLYGSVFGWNGVVQRQSKRAASDTLIKG